jgi:single-strand DNA-binding protein
MNKAILLGRLTKDPEIRYTTTQKVVCTCTLAVDRPFVSQNGEREADFVPVVLWGKTAELVGNNCAKGHRLLVEGRIQVRTYEKDGTTHWATEMVGEHIEFIERKTPANPTENGETPF